MSRPTTSVRIRRQSTLPPYPSSVAEPMLNEASSNVLQDRTASIHPFQSVSNNTGMNPRPRSQTMGSLFGRAPNRAGVSPRSKSMEGDPQCDPSRPMNGVISRHISSRRNPQLVRRASHSFDTRQQQNEVTAHGSQVDILIPNETLDDPGEMESNLSRSQKDELEHHEDEIVDHLEVIDPQIATVSNLSNAANSILIPPMSLYSRRPVIHLPKSSTRNSGRSKEDNGEHAMDELDRHVGDVLRKRDKVRRTIAGIWSFMKTPMGIVASVYGFLVAFFGAALVFFLLNWIPTSSKDRQGFWVEVCSQIENALFTVTGIGLLPWRVIDTYRIIKIWHLKRVSARLRKKAGLPELYDEDDLPDAQYDPNFVHVLTDEQQKDLHHQQKEFMKSQTWYRPHGTETHRAFPIGTALWICLYVDGNSFFQALLCSCMWSMDRFQRPAWTTGTLIPASFLCGIIAAVLIWRGGQKTKRTQIVEERLRAALEVERQTTVPAAIVAVRHTSTNTSFDNIRPDLRSPTIDEHMTIPQTADLEKYADEDTESLPTS